MINNDQHDKIKAPGASNVIPYETNSEDAKKKNNLTEKDKAEEKNYDQVHEARQNVVGDAKINSDNLKTDLQTVQDKEEQSGNK